jgi:hypothetical protein
MDEPTPVAGPPPAPQPASNDSLLQGFLIAWGAVIGAYIIGPILFGAIAGAGGVGAGLVLIVLLLAPWALGIWLIVHFSRQGKPRTAKGVALGLASIFGVLVLLVSACFTLLSNTNFH